MEYQSQKSKCDICNKEFTQRGITKHIKSCINKQLVNECGIDNLYIVVQDLFNPDYFFHLLISQTVSFKDLDKFLRKKWLECCGHLSAFRCEKKREEVPVSRKICQTIYQGDTLNYQYDFGSTTELEIKCIGNFTVVFKGDKKIQILSRNSQPLIPCDECGEFPLPKFVLLASTGEKVGFVKNVQRFMIVVKIYIFCRL